MPGPCMEVLNKIMPRVGEEIDIYNLRDSKLIYGQMSQKSPRSFGKTKVNGTTKTYRRDFKPEDIFKNMHQNHEGTLYNEQHLNYNRS